MRAYTKRKYKQFPVFWQTVRRILTHVVALTALVAGVITGIYFLLMYAVDNPVARIWIPAPLFGPVLAVAVWRLRVFRHLVSGFKADALTEPDEETDAEPPVEPPAEPRKVKKEQEKDPDDEPPVEAPAEPRKVKKEQEKETVS